LDLITNPRRTFVVLFLDSVFQFLSESKKTRAFLGSRSRRDWHFAYMIRGPGMGTLDERFEQGPKRKIVVGAAQLTVDLKIVKRHTALVAFKIARFGGYCFFLNELLENLIHGVVWFYDHALFFGTPLTEMLLALLRQRIRNVNGSLGLIAALTNKTHFQLVPYRTNSRQPNFTDTMLHRQSATVFCTKHAT